MSEQFIPAKGATAYVDYYRNNHPEHSLFSADTRVGRESRVNSKSSTSNVNRPRSSSVGRFRVVSPPLVSNSELSVNQQQGLPSSSELSVNQQQGLPSSSEPSVNQQQGLPSSSEPSVNQQQGLPSSSEPSVNQQQGLPISQGKPQKGSSNSGSCEDSASIPERRKRGFGRNRHSSGKATVSQPTDAKELFASHALGVDKAKAHVFDGCLAKPDVVVKVEPVSPPKQQNQLEPSADPAPTESSMDNGALFPRSVSVARSDSIQNSPYSSPIKEPVKVPRNPVPASILRQYHSPRAHTPIFRPRHTSNFPLSPISKPYDETFQLATTSENAAEIDQFVKTGTSNTEQSDVGYQQLIDEAMKEVGRMIPKPELFKAYSWSPGKGILDRGIVTCADHLNNLYIRLSKDKKAVINFEENLNNHYEQYNSQKQPIVPDILQLGAYYVGKVVTLSPQFFRHHWCRCLLLKIKKETVLVQLIDYGRVIECQKNEFHPLQPAFRDQSVMCIGPCALAGVSTNEQWEKATKMLVPLNAVVSAYLTVGVDGSLIVNIYKHERDTKVVTHINASATNVQT